MSQHNNLEVTDSDRWRKIFPLSGKSILHIGSGPGNDIELPWRADGGVVSWRIQMIALRSQPPAYRVVNLGDASLSLGIDGERVLLPHTVADITDGEHIQVGGFRLILHCSDVALGPEDNIPEGGSKNIGLELFLPESQLYPGREISGSVEVQNLGNVEQGAQFRLEVEGLDHDCYEMGAGPLLFPGARREVFFRVYHSKQPKLLAGERRFRIYAMAPDVYSGERATVTGSIYVHPFYRHKLQLAIEEE